MYKRDSIQIMTKSVKLYRENQKLLFLYALSLEIKKQ